MAKVFISGEKLRIELGFWESVGALAKSFSIPLSDISRVKFSETLAFGDLGWRVGGTAIPRTIALGHFRNKKRRIFAAWKKPQKVAFIYLDNHKFDILVIGADSALVEKLSSRV